MNSLYLKSNVKLEPLWNQWYAWPMLLQPATAACICAKTHLKILRSYLKAPHLHKAAVKNPMMRGGPFMDYSGGIEKVTELVENTEQNLATLLQLSEAIEQLDKLLQQADGMSLEPLYQQMPDILKGYVELGYDLNNNASMRFIEPLLYNGPLYQPQLQSINLSLLSADNRPFVLSTPRLKDDHELQLPIDFADPLIDRLFAMKSVAADAGIIDEIIERFDLNDNHQQQLRELFTENAPDQPIAEPLAQGEVRVRYFGHATVLVESNDTCILTDPVIGYRFDGASTRYGFEDLPDKIDYVVLTHNHQDHVMLESLLQLRHKIGTIVVPAHSGGALQDPSLKLILQAAGFKSVVALEELEKLPVTGGYICGLPFFGEHGDLHVRSKLAFMFELEGEKVLCAADSNNIAPQMYQHLHDMFGDIDHIFIGMECEGAPMSWLYGPLYSKPLTRPQDQSRRLNGSNCDRAMGIIELFNPSQVYVYAMGMEPWLSFISSIKYQPESMPIVESNRLIDMCREKDIQAKRLNGCASINIKQS